MGVLARDESLEGLLFYENLFPEYCEQLSRL